MKINGVEMGVVASFLIEAYPHLPPESQRYLLQRLRADVERDNAAREAVRRSLRVIHGGQQ